MTFVTADAALIAALIDDLYAAFLTGDRQRFDGHLHADVTTWETHLPGPLRSRAELDAYRDQRDAAGQRPRLAVLTAQDKRIDVWGEVGLARYVLVARSGDEDPPSASRVTDVLRRVDGRWQIVHHHAELLRDPVGTR
ncbi:nuclear transport factor 2 family protein [Micromonospora sp. CA-263727]|uniref:nuclear transport factor 2 family protein n=1 Tax=Micromonospora sp. CA-263727 TaxID=3239967 RepID=UPI003D8DE1B3